MNPDDLHLLRQADRQLLAYDDTTGEYLLDGEPVDGDVDEQIAGLIGDGLIERPAHDVSGPLTLTAGGRLALAEAARQ